MSNALAEVKFKDGTVLYTQYQGSSDTFYNALFKTKDDAWGHNRHTDAGWSALTRSEPMQEPEDVTAYSHYGGGSEFPGKACRKTMQLRVEYPPGWFGGWDD